VSGVGGSIRYRGSEGIAGSRVPVAGVTGGFDATLGEHLVVGASGGLATPRVNLDDSTDRATGRMTGLGVYGRYRARRSRVDATIGAGRHRYETQRLVTDGVDPAVASASFDGTSIGWQFEYGQSFPAGAGVAIEPEVGLQGASVGFDAIREQSASVLGLAAPERTVASRRSLAGARVSKAFERGPRAKVSVEARAAWAHEFALRNELPVRFDGDSWTNGFLIAPARRVRNTALIGGTVAGRASAGLRLFAEIDSEIGGPLSSWRGNVGVQKSW
jgi:outer membrane autotransporter protein